MTILEKIKSKFSFFIDKFTFSSISYWEERARKYGALSVLNLGHSPDEMRRIKDIQIKAIFPLLKKKLTGDEKKLLDFGCGPGRFSGELAKATHCSVIAVDPVQYLLDLAPENDNVQYKLMNNGQIPADNESFDIIWICLVLGGIVNKKQLNGAIKELNRVAKKGCLLLLIENTSDKKDILSWRYRRVQDYIGLFKNFDLVHLDDYYDSEECISIFSGRHKI